MNYVTSDTELTAVADAIRAKTGGSAEIEYPTEYVSEIGKLHSNAEVNTLHGAIKGKILPSTPNLWDSQNERAPVESGKHYKATLTYTPGASAELIAFMLYYMDGEGTMLGTGHMFEVEIEPGTYDGSTEDEFVFQVPDMIGAVEGTDYYLTYSDEYDEPSAVDIRENGPRTASEWLSAVNNGLVKVNPATGVEF